MPANPGEFTMLLDAARRGSGDAAERVIPMVYDELRDMAAGFMHAEHAVVTLDPTALVHEAWLRLAGDAEASWENRRHFFGAAARSMRRILIEHARRRRVRGERADVSVNGLEAPAGWTWDALLQLDGALEELEREDARKHEIVMLRYFSGRTVEETAATMGLSERTVKREWRFIRAWLTTRLQRDETP